MKAKALSNLSNLPEVESFPLLAHRVALTQKEVSYVQQKAQCVAEFCLRRLTSTWTCDRGGSAAVPVASLDLLSLLPISPLHRNLFLHALAGQLSAFSGGELSHPDVIQPLWLELMLRGNGLRRMTTDTAQYAQRLTRLVGSPTPSDLGARYVTDPWRAYRLALFELALEHLSRKDGHESIELEFRVRLADSGVDEGTARKIDEIAPRGAKARISLISSSVAYLAKQKRHVPAFFVNELEEWLSQVKGAGISGEDAVLIAQVTNALNLTLLGKESTDTVLRNISSLLSDVTPKIEDRDRRAHIEGNAFYQLSILARLDGDRPREIAALLQAMGSDRHFTTLYYRTAQVLHDLGDTRAGPFYEMALALSPLDFPTANDYGCWLSDSGQDAGLESWTALCRALYPEQFADPIDQEVP